MKIENKNILKNLSEYSKKAKLLSMIVGIGIFTSSLVSVENKTKTTSSNEDYFEQRLPSDSVTKEMLRFNYEFNNIIPNLPQMNVDLTGNWIVSNATGYVRISSTGDGETFVATVAENMVIDGNARCVHKTGEAIFAFSVGASYPDSSWGRPVTNVYGAAAELWYYDDGETCSADGKGYGNFKFSCGNEDCSKSNSDTLEFFTKYTAHGGTYTGKSSLKRKI